MKRGSLSFGRIKGCTRPACICPTCSERKVSAYYPVPASKAETFDLMPSSIALVHSRRKRHFPLPSFVDVRLPTYHNAFIAENVQRSDCQAEYITSDCLRRVNAVIGRR